jgi:hypothetical protein
MWRQCQPHHADSKRRYSAERLLLESRANAITGVGQKAKIS